MAGDRDSTAAGRKRRRSEETIDWDRRRLACRFRRGGEGKRGGLEEAERLRADLAEVVQRLLSGACEEGSAEGGGAGGGDGGPSSPEAVVTPGKVDSSTAPSKFNKSLSSLSLLRGLKTSSLSAATASPVRGALWTAPRRRRTQQTRPLTAQSIRANRNHHRDGRNSVAEARQYAPQSRRRRSKELESPRRRRGEISEFNDGSEESSRSSSAPHSPKGGDSSVSSSRTNSTIVDIQIQPGKISSAAENDGRRSPSCKSPASKSASTSCPSLPSIGENKDSDAAPPPKKKRKRKQKRKSSSSRGRSTPSNSGRCPSIDGEFSPPRRQRWFMRKTRLQLESANNDNPSSSPDPRRLKTPSDNDEDNWVDPESFQRQAVVRRRRCGARRGRPFQYGGMMAGEVPSRRMSARQQNQEEEGDYLDIAQRRFREMAVAEKKSGGSLDFSDCSSSINTQMDEEEEGADRDVQETERLRAMARDLGLYH